MHFYCIFELAESYTTRFHQKTCKKRLKKAKNRSKCPNYFPILAKGANFFPLPPITENVNFVHPCLIGLNLVLIGVVGYIWSWMIVVRLLVLGVVGGIVRGCIVLGPVVL